MDIERLSFKFWAFPLAFDINNSHYLTLIINLRTNLTKFNPSSPKEGSFKKDSQCFNATPAMGFLGSLPFFLLGKKLGTGADVSEGCHFHLKCVLVVFLWKTEFSPWHRSIVDFWELQGISFLWHPMLLSCFNISTLWARHGLDSKYSVFCLGCHLCLLPSPLPPVTSGLAFCSQMNSSKDRSVIPICTSYCRGCN
jgi:hypothetical protein